MREEKIQDLTRRLEYANRKGSSLRRWIFRSRGVEEDTFLVTVSDFMTLLLIFFIMLYRTSGTAGSSEQQKGPYVPSSMVELAMPIIPPVVPKMGVSSVRHQIPQANKGSLDTLKEEVVRFLGRELNRDFYIRAEDRQLVVVLGENITYETGKAQILERFKPTLTRLARFLKEKPELTIVISGHTDDTPIHNEEFPSNWELSTARAVSVARALIAAGVDAKRLSVQGYAEHLPLFRNDSEARKQANRRVEVALVVH